jgi:ribulose-5-phosphate 4-epimerase/fuculose-1-phosphate aldolase
MTSETTLAASALKAWRFLYRRGFIEGFGHLSVRLPGGDRLLLTRHSLGPIATAEDFIVMDLDGRKVSGPGEPPGEWPIHVEILKARADVNSVVHYHGMYSTAFTTSEHTLKPIHGVATMFHDGIPTYPDPKLITTRERGAALAKTLGAHRAVLLRAHGTAITGASVEETTAGAFLFEENAHRAWLSAAMGRPLWIDEATAAETGAEMMKHRGPFRRVWALVEAEDREQP